MPQQIEFLTAETERGRQAIAQVMQRSYVADIDDVPPAWVRARAVDGVPVSFIVVDPDRQMAFPAADVRYAFICDVATREDRRREGHFRAIVEHTLASLCAAGIPFVVTHGRYPLYRRFGFDVFTHHGGIFVAPTQIERTLGAAPRPARQLLDVEDHPYLWGDMLLVTEARAGTPAEARAALQAAAAVARERGKTRILFEHPAAPSYGSRYPIYPSPETPLAALAHTCGAEVRIQGADPEGSPIPDADWIKVLDAAAFVRAALDGVGDPGPVPQGRICLDTDAGRVTIACTGSEVVASDEVQGGAETVRWPSAALAQLVTGYRSAEVLCAIHDTPLSSQAVALLQALFPPRWRFSRNESWTFRS
jgi:hypothetical protein